MPLPIRRATPQRPPTRGRSRIAPAQPYNSGGIAPIVTVAVQKRRPLRAVPDANSGAGVLAAISPQIVIAPPFNSGGIIPRLTTGVRRKNLSRPGSRIQVAPRYNGGGVPSVTAIGVRRKMRAALRAQVIVTTANVVLPGTPPRVTMGVKRPPPQRGRSRRQIAPPYNSGGILAAITQGIRRKPGPVKPSRRQVAPPYNSGGAAPVIVQGVRRRPAAPKLGRLQRSATALGPIVTAARQTPRFIRRGLGRLVTVFVPSALPAGTGLRFYVESREPAASLDAVQPRNDVDSLDPPANLSTTVRGR